MNEYGPVFQTKVIGGLLTQKKFLLAVADSIEASYFENSSQNWIVTYIIEYYEKYKINPTLEIIAIEIKKIENEVVRIALTETLKESYKLADSEDIEYVEREFTKFCQNQRMKSAIMESVDLLAVGDYDGIKELIVSAAKIGEDHSDTGHNYEENIEERYRDEDRNVIPFPDNWGIFNDLTQGGIGSGDLVLIFGNPGGGKSWGAIDIAANAARLGYNVVYYTLELGAGYVGKRFDANHTGINVDELKENLDKIREVVGKLPGKVRIKEYPPKKASFDTLHSHLRELYEKEGFKPDLIVIDYLDYMMTKGRTDRKAEIDDIYVNAKGFAKELMIPVVSPSQANRSGAGKDIIEGDNIAGSYDKLMIGDIVFSLARGRKDKINGTGRWHVMKNRFGADGMTFNSAINLANGYIKIDETPMIDDDDDDPAAPKGWEKRKGKAYGEVDDDDKDYLRKKFFEMNTHIGDDEKPLNDLPF